MVSLQKAQTGNRVYGGVSTSPNRGQVSARGAQGYIQRELKNKAAAGIVRPIGRDGASDRRSTVAAQAMARQQGFQQGEKHQNSGKAGPKTTPSSKSKWQAAKKKQNRAGTFSGPNSAPNPNMPNQPPVSQPTIPTITVNSNGTLELPYNQDFASGQLEAINAANEQLLGLKMEGDQQALEYGQAKRNSELAYNSLRGQTLNQNAARGTAFSSQYGTAVANNATQFANEVSDLEQQNTNFRQNQSLQQQTIQTALNKQLATMAQEYADSLNDEAGTLGYGQATAQEQKSNKKVIDKRRAAKKRRARQKQNRKAGKK